ncbi:3' terminal RNA ribose 2'-O-methyltransferase Hen1 [Galbitalea sp. SE-J8]|uniref:3' terminal RNA ribose 2'-O-methyltransferase Hen1 n=1 Tax=Galbitalea sp. SE-J8 TaxID=3054952 RepID=UPI00259C72F3|nr:3' terminal RNA ribose 2'-O-methyltransferase Hen1 [Galbitalea sp. SE-J8]MDM4763648.1 3' terminal RNA ribose 2'-O-methyltransferase Hen1 [Galbitalea sp. SE-J8]
MLLTITYEAPDAADLGFLLHKHPDRHQRFPLSVGQAHVFYPVVEAGVCTAALLLEVDPIGLVRGWRGSDAFALGQYVNDRPYVASSLLAVAIKQVFGTALTGRCDARPELAARPLPLRLELAAVPDGGEADLVARLFEPLGWRVEVGRVPLDPARPDWGDAPTVSVALEGEVRLRDALRQLYLLLPVLDGAKHYWVGDDEGDKVLQSGEGWLAAHPERDLILRRSLACQRELVADATARLLDADDASTRATETDADAAPRVPSLARQRAASVLAALADVGAHSVADVGCGEGALLADLVADPRFERIVGTDVSARALERAAERLHLDERGDRARERVQLLHSSVTYVDPRLRGLDAIVLMEVIEHVDSDRLDALEGSVLGDARPASVIVTTPNAEYNALYPALATGARRHPDHRFEWTRAEFAAWTDAVAGRRGYRVEHRGVGPVDGALGAPTQLAILRREGTA